MGALSLGVQAEELTVAPFAMEAGTGGRREGLLTVGTNLLSDAHPRASAPGQVAMGGWLDAPGKGRGGSPALTHGNPEQPPRPAPQGSAPALLA